VDSETAVNTGALEADEDAEFWGGLDLFSCTEGVEIGTCRIKGRARNMDGDMLGGYSKGK
jgi:hypothetical protein